MKKFLYAVLMFSIALFYSSFADAKQIVEQRGGKVMVVKYDNDTWDLLVEGKPYFIKGVIYSPVKIGESPGEATMRDWMQYFDKGDSRNDMAFHTFIDKNRNGKKDANEEEAGDFKLMKEMGINTIRLYHLPSDNPLVGSIYKDNTSAALQYDHPVNKELLRRLYKDYGIMVMMGNFLGSWTIGSGASWDKGTDYRDPRQRENIKNSVKAMVLDNKDEPYVLMWVLGNENNIADWSNCNAKTQPEAYSRLVGELVDMIHGIDPGHPVAVCDGDDDARMLKEHAKYAQGIDIIAYNSYRGKDGFGNLWRMAKRTMDRPVFISEFGVFAYNENVGEDQDMQLEYLRGCWRDIVLNSAGRKESYAKCAGNSIGGIVFDWVDRWYMDGTPYEHNPGTRRSFIYPDGLQHEEWFGVMSMGNGRDTLARQERKSYNYFKTVWNEDAPSFE